MGYSSKGRKPIERASKIAHGEIINNPGVVAFLKGCALPSAPVTMDFSAYLHRVVPADTSGVRAVIAIDGGVTETYVQEEFPSAIITFFTFGPLLFTLSDLRHLDRQRFIAPEDLAALKRLQRYTLTLPTKGICLTGERSLAASIRRTIYDFFNQQVSPAEDPLIAGLSWFLFRRWMPLPDATRREVLTHCPNRACDATGLAFDYDTPTCYPCPSCGEPVYLTDVFRLHERVDEEQGAGSITSYVLTMLEQIVLIHTIRTIWMMKPSLLGEILFIKDGPLAYFGQVAPLYRPMRELVRFLLDQRGVDGRALLYLVGVEKSGPFVEHATAIEDQLPRDSVLIPDNAYIYHYIIPGDPVTQTYGGNTYYGTKVFYKSARNDMYVVTVPPWMDVQTPQPGDLPNLDAILSLIAELRCHMYDNALVPVALANKLVSLSDFPSQRILTAFARQEIS